MVRAAPRAERRAGRDGRLISDSARGAASQPPQGRSGPRAVPLASKPGSGPVFTAAGPLPEPLLHPLATLVLHTYDRGMNP